MKNRLVRKRLIAVKVSLYGLFLFILVDSYRKISFLLDIKEMNREPIIYATLLLYLPFLLVCKHKYWFVSWLLLFASKLSENIVVRFFLNNELMIYNKIFHSTTLVSIVGLLLLLISLVYLIRFWRIKNYPVYFWLRQD